MISSGLEQAVERAVRGVVRCAAWGGGLGAGGVLARLGGWRKLPERERLAEGGPGGSRRRGPWRTRVGGGAPGARRGRGFLAHLSRRRGGVHGARWSGAERGATSAGMGPRRRGAAGLGRRRRRNARRS